MILKRVGWICAARGCEEALGSFQQSEASVWCGRCLLGDSSETGASAR